MKSLRTSALASKVISIGQEKDAPLSEKLP